MADAQRAQDHPISDKQRAIIDWFAGYIGKPVPESCYDSNSMWWGFLRRNLTRTHVDIANEMRIDFNLPVDLNDPVSVIGALMFFVEVQNSDKSKKALQREEAKKLLRAGADPWSVEEQFGLTEEEIWDLVREVEAEGYLLECA